MPCSASQTPPLGALSPHRDICILLRFNVQCRAILRYGSVRARARAGAGDGWHAACFTQRRRSGGRHVLAPCLPLSKARVFAACIRLHFRPRKSAYLSRCEARRPNSETRCEDALRRGGGRHAHSCGARCVVRGTARENAGLGSARRGSPVSACMYGHERLIQVCAINSIGD